VRADKGVTGFFHSTYNDAPNMDTSTACRSGRVVHPRLGFQAHKTTPDTQLQLHMWAEVCAHDPARGGTNGSRCFACTCKMFCMHVHHAVPSKITRQWAHRPALPRLGAMLQCHTCGCASEPSQCPARFSLACLVVRGGFRARLLPEGGP
jgi:hypothetical protein